MHSSCERHARNSGVAPFSTGHTCHTSNESHRIARVLFLGAATSKRIEAASSVLNKDDRVEAATARLLGEDMHQMCRIRTSSTIMMSCSRSKSCTFEFSALSYCDQQLIG
jgi:hypothetical protein